MMSAATTKPRASASGVGTASNAGMAAITSRRASASRFTL
jgi:hypothetical protein